MDHAPPHGSEIILLTDDEPQVRKTTAMILEKYGYEVIQAGSAEEALRLAATWSFDLLLMDVILPGMTGLSLAYKIRDMMPGTRVLFYSAYATPGILDDQFMVGPGVAFIQKPFAPEKMAWAVRKLLDEPLPANQEEEEAPTGTESILIMEEDPKAMRFMVKSLERMGYHIFEAPNLDWAVSVVLNSQVDLLLTELGPPQMTGPAVARALVASKPALRVLFLSDAEAPEDGFGLQPGAPEPTLLRKPFNALELGRAVRKVLDRPSPR